MLQRVPFCLQLFESRTTRHSYKLRPLQAFKRFFTTGILRSGDSIGHRNSASASLVLMVVKRCTPNMTNPKTAPKAKVCRVYDGENVRHSHYRRVV